MINGIEIIGFQNYLLKDSEVEKKNLLASACREGFTRDYNSGILRRYQGEFVVYYGDRMCGHRNSSGRPLLDVALGEYLIGRIAVYRVPLNDSGLEAMLRNPITNDEEIKLDAQTFK